MAKYNLLAALAKVETLYGTDATPTGGADAILLQEVEITPMEAERVERPVIRPYLGAKPYVLGGKRTRLTATVDLAGAGAAGTAPPYAALLRGCGLDETLTTGVKAEYEPVSSGEESLSCYFNLDGTLHKALGARGTFGIEMQARQFSRLTFDLQGFYVAPAAVALPAVTLTAWKEPRPVGYVDTPVLKLDNYSAPTESFSYAHNNQVVFRDLIGKREVIITDRAPSATLVIEAPLMGNKDFFALANAQTPVAFEVTHGLTGGNKVTIRLPQVQILNPRYTNMDGIAMLNLDLAVLPASGDDEFLLEVL